MDTSIYTFTICTPVYNGSSTISRVFDSLKNQTFTDFEWIVIDDGSIDGSSNIIKNFQKISSFPIHLITQSNQGKASAVNAGIKKACGDLFIIADADDSFSSVSLEHLHFIWEKYGNDNFCGIASICQDQYGNLVGAKYPDDVYYYNYLKNNYSKNKIGGEKWLMIQTKIMKQYLFQPHKEYIPESHVWNAIGYKYDIIGINTILRTYYVNESMNSITQQGKINPPYFGRSYVYKELINKFMQNINYLERYKIYKMYLKNAILANLHYSQILRDIEGTSNKVFLLLFFPSVIFNIYIRKIK